MYRCLSRNVKKKKSLKYSCTELAGIARERHHRKVAGQAENTGGKSFVGHVRRPSVGQAVRYDD